MLIGGPSATTALVIEQSRNMGYKGGFLLVDQAKMDFIAQMLEGTSKMENLIGLMGYATAPGPSVPAFDKRYKANYRRLTTWEVASVYDSMIYLAKAIQAANTVDDVYAIRASFPKAFPMLSDKTNNEYHGISSTGRIYNMIGVQEIKNGKFLKSDMYVWWAKTPADFDKAQKITKFPVQLKLLKPKIGNFE
jgi:branched-chain amino acid transport system substrate-binding protein